MLSDRSVSLSVGVVGCFSKSVRFSYLNIAIQLSVSVI